MVEKFENILCRLISSQSDNGRDVLSSLLVREVGYEILGEFFKPDKERYNTLFDKLRGSRKKFEKFDRTIRFYYFWCKRPSVSKSLQPDFKLIVMFSLIELLMSNVKYLSLEDWLKKETKRGSASIKDLKSLNETLDEYHSTYGSKRKIMSFFEKYYSSKSLEALEKSITTWDKTAEEFKVLSSIREVVDFVIGARNIFIHRATSIQISSQEEYKKEAEGYTSFSSSLLMSVNGKSYNINRENVHIETLLSGFEEGLYNFFFKEINVK